MRWLSALVAAIAGCAGSPPDLVGVWKSVEGGEKAAVLQLNADGTFLRLSKLAELEVRTEGTYTVERDRILFRVRQEGSAGQPARFPTRFRIEDTALVLHPGTEGEERFLLRR